MLFSKTVEKIYRKTAFARRDPDGTVFYFSPEDFEGLLCERISFENKNGDNLVGCFYAYPDAEEDNLIVFDHGMGTGHRAYLPEIVTLARHGYKVFTYDHTGCGESGGTSILGLSGSLPDLDCAIKEIKRRGYLEGRELYAVGHSWGGFSVMNIPAFHPDVKKLVAMSGFESLPSMHKERLGGLLSLYRPLLYELEVKENGIYARSSAIEALGNMKGEALIIHSTDDKTVRAKFHFDRLKKALSDKENVSFITLSGKEHNPTYTRAAVKYKNEFFRERERLKKRKLLETESQRRAFIEKFDWRRMTEQDPELWSEIFNFLDK